MAQSGEGIRVASSNEADSMAAALEMHRLLDQDRLGLVVIFASTRYDLPALAHGLQRAFGSVPVVGCTTAGEIGTSGYGDGGVTGFSLALSEITAEIGLIENVSTLQARQGQSFAYALRQKLINRVTTFRADQSFALMLVDGLCMQEEIVARSIHDGLGGIPLVGGSAGDELNFQQTSVLYDGCFHSDAALLLVGMASRRITAFKTQHFLCDDRRLVVTSADPSRRIVMEINGFSAAEEYARVVGLSLSELDPMVFSSHPMVVKIGGADFVRSIQKVNADGSITFYCAIDEGIVFNVAEGVDMVENLQALFDDVERRIGLPSLVIGCDCILRRLEMDQKQLGREIAAIMRAKNVVGFNTYGEQFRGMHVNQTFTGIAFGPRVDA
jgi:hypothetical protein